MLPVNPKAEPTADQLKRAAIADALFRLHNDVNIVISSTAIAILTGAEISTSLDRLELTIHAAIGHALRSEKG